MSKQSGFYEDNAALRGIIGESPQMIEVFSTIKKVAASDVPVLIQGESGTGKELVAKAIYKNSLRKDYPMVPINITAIPENLLESELFGYEKGAFTGANFQVQGKVEYAHKGTLFLDEIGELPANLQVKILRFLQEKTIQRLGGRGDINVDARIIAATNVDIKKAIQQGKFRNDLYYRIGVVKVEVPPLRERGEDVYLLAEIFLKKYSKQFGKEVKGFTESALELLYLYDWPGNVRELENIISRAVIMSESVLLKTSDLGFDEVKKPINHIIKFFKGMTLKEARDSIEQHMVYSAIDKNKGAISSAAKMLGISRPTLYYLIKKHGYFNYKNHNLVDS
jgi:two-component system, NtrC family, response regulator